MKNVTELRNSLAKIFVELQSGDINHEQARELAKIAGKMINSAKVQLDYQNLRGDIPQIPFLDK
jgi:hypothetical protein